MSRCDAPTIQQLTIEMKDAMRHGASAIFLVGMADLLETQPKMMRQAIHEAGVEFAQEIDQLRGRPDAMEALAVHLGRFLNRMRPPLLTEKP